MWTHCVCFTFLFISNFFFSKTTGLRLHGGLSYVLYIIEDSEVLLQNELSANTGNIKIVEIFSLE